MKATLRLFNAVQMNEDNNYYEMNEDNNYYEINATTIRERSIKNGYILDAVINFGNKVLSEIESVVGISGEKANSAFHKSWSIIQDSPHETLFIQQVMHYFTTYGFEKLGVYSKDTIYIPNEILTLPEITEDIPLVVIRVMTKSEILEEIIKLGSSGIALAQETLDDIMVIVEANKYSNNFVEEIKNRELRILLYDYYGVVPCEPVEYLRYLISKLTDESLIIKNDYLIDKIKESNGKFLDELLRKAPANLASIFFRFKPLFLAMKKISKNKTFFNQLRRKANKMHVPVPEDYLNSITAKIKNFEKLDMYKLTKSLDKVNIYRKIRLANALYYRLKPKKSIVYRIRNGKGWATNFEYSCSACAGINHILDTVIYSIILDIKKNVEGKTFYIPKNINYALPATEKQFTGHFPTGSYVVVPEDLILGIHWKDTSATVDLDLSVISESGKIGWDGSYRSEDNKVLFSGDITAAPNGASELFYIKKDIPEASILLVNYYNFENRVEDVDCKIIAAKESVENFDKDYMLDINKIIAQANIKITKKQTVLGLIVNIEDENRFYFYNTSVGNSITSSDMHGEHVRNYLLGMSSGFLDLKNILESAGAAIVDEKPEGEYIDLSSEALNKNTIIDLLRS